MGVFLFSFHLPPPNCIRCCCEVLSWEDCDRSQYPLLFLSGNKKKSWDYKDYIFIHFDPVHLWGWGNFNLRERDRELYMWGGGMLMPLRVCDT